MSLPGTWRVTTPMLSGPAVERHQRAVNRVFANQRFPWLDVIVDGELGPDTLRGSRQAAYMLGALSRELDRLHGGALSAQTRKLIDGRRGLRPLERLAAARRKPTLDRRRKNHREGATAVLAWAQQQIGVVEMPPGSNRGPLISAWQREFGMDGQPWCGAFTGYASKKIGGAPITSRVVYTPYTVNDARAGVNGFVGLFPPAAARPGDHAMFNFPGGQSVDHTGLVKEVRSGELVTIEGNTSSGSSGSQANGGGVFERRRPFSQVVGCARPRY